MSSRCPILFLASTDLSALVARTRSMPDIPGCYQQGIVLRPAGCPILSLFVLFVFHLHPAIVAFCLYFPLPQLDACILRILYIHSFKPTHFEISLLNTFFALLSTHQIFHRNLIPQSSRYTSQYPAQKQTSSRHKYTHLLYKTDIHEHHEVNNIRPRLAASYHCHRTTPPSPTIPPEASRRCSGRDHHRMGGSLRDRICNRYHLGL